MTLLVKGAWKKMNQPHTHILCDCEAIAYLRFRHLGQFFVEPSDYYDATIKPYISFEV
jgi:hypothetical protein